MIPLVAEELDVGKRIVETGRVRVRKWADVETDARTNWEQSNPGTWEEFKGSVRYALDKVRGKR